MSKYSLEKMIIYTDGACSGNPGPGGWGAVLLHNASENHIYGSSNLTTNNIMELTAPIEALKLLQKTYIIDLYTDSNYVKLGITQWIFSWKKNHWRNSQKQIVKNLELWQELDLLAQKHKINWHWIKAHNNNIYNDLADKLAVKGRDEAKFFPRND